MNFSKFSTLSMSFSSRIRLRMALPTMSTLSSPLPDMVVSSTCSTTLSVSMWSMACQSGKTTDT